MRAGSGPAFLTYPNFQVFSNWKPAIVLLFDLGPAYLERDK